MRVSLIVATADNGVIGNDGQIPWRLPSDLKNFKKLTMGHALIMGRKTHISIGKPLPGRTTIVMTRGGGYLPYAPSVHVAADLKDALDIAYRLENSGEAFICGGGEVYREALASGEVERIYRTVIERHIKGDTMFVMDFVNYKRTEITHVEGEGLPHRFEIWERK
jgi:dihydrofolate reductase